ncbi:unnamed protein product [Candida verbasci]|uniref:Major facilitator superfamily (MFS) profile domain-containing protein n=1 Tax=Candida verbasci TaxID=1227364 RepID=A0A9W4XJK5_9ASCO|nr:unnamed protein product [Candida verbasci]
MSTPIAKELTIEGKEKDGEYSQTSDKTEFVYTIFESKEKFMLIIVLSLVGFWSTVSSPIYFPALPVLTAYFDTTPSVMNLSVVAYLIFQGIAPTFSSNLADSIGRRPIILASILIFVAACIALSQTNVYWLLAVLRCIQAAGIAPVIAISSGVAGDVCTPSNRGGFVGQVAGLQLIGNGFGPLIGAALMSSFQTWRSIFIFLAIGGGVTFILAFIFLAETSRRIVGNGTIKPKNLLNRAVLIYFPFFKKKMSNDVSTIVSKRKFDLFGPFKIFFRKKVFLILLPSGLHFATWTMSLTLLSTELESSKYNYSIMHVGLMYLPQGIACFVGSMAIGKSLNWYYKYRKNLYDTSVEKLPLLDRPAFNLVTTRLTLSIVPAFLMITGLLIFGWCLQYQQHIVSIIISTVCISLSASLMLSICTTLLVDLYPNQGSASASCLNLMRCLIAAVGTGVLDKMIAKLNLGGTYSLLAGLCLITDLNLIYVLHLETKRLRKDHHQKLNQNVKSSDVD